MTLTFRPIKFIFRYIFKILLKLYRPYFTIKKLFTKPVNRLFIFRYVDGFIILIIFLLVLANNFETKYALAENLGKESLLRKIISSEFEEEIVETIVSEPAEIVQTKVTKEVSPIEAGAINIKDAPRPAGTQNLTQQTGVSGTTSALIKPNITGSKNTSTRSEIVYYEVQSGDNIGYIAESFNLKQNTLLWANQLSPNSLIRPGDKLVILPVDGVYHQVKRGDTISKIAKLYSADEENIIEFNQLAEAGEISIGQKLVVPEGKVTYSTPEPSGLSSIRSIFTTPSTISAKGFVWPSYSRRITQYYHLGHSAIDIGGQRGSNIVASKAGRVERAGWTTGYGYNVVIDHGGGVKTLYAHADNLYVQRGDQVQAGQAIGALGNTGWSTGPHIHFEIIINGRKVNPLSYL